MDVTKNVGRVKGLLVVDSTGEGKGGIGFFKKLAERVG